jgi:hypothetical protein
LAKVEVLPKEKACAEVGMNKTAVAKLEIGFVDTLLLITQEVIQMH